MNKLKTVLSLLLLTSYVFASSQQPLWQSWEKGKKAAKIEKKIILLKAVRTDCHFCTEMQAYVLDKEGMKRFISENFVSVSINVSSEPLPLHLSTTMVPAFFFITPEGKLIKKVSGAWGYDDFISIMEDILKKSHR